MPLQCNFYDVSVELQARLPEPFDDPDYRLVVLDLLGQSSVPARVSFDTKFIRTLARYLSTFDESEWEHQKRQVEKQLNMYADKYNFGNSYPQNAEALCRLVSFWKIALNAEDRNAVVSRYCSSGGGFSRPGGRLLLLSVGAAPCPKIPDDFFGDLTMAIKNHLSGNNNLAREINKDDSALDDTVNDGLKQMAEKFGQAEDCLSQAFARFIRERFELMVASSPQYLRKFDKYLANKFLSWHATKRRSDNSRADRIRVYTASQSPLPDETGSDKAVAEEKLDRVAAFFGPSIRNARTLSARREALVILLQACLIAHNLDPLEKTLNDQLVVSLDLLPGWREFAVNSYEKWLQQEQEKAAELNSAECRLQRQVECLNKMVGGSPEWRAKYETYKAACVKHREKEKSYLEKTLPDTDARAALFGVIDPREQKRMRAARKSLLTNPHSLFAFLDGENKQ